MTATSYRGSDFLANTERKSKRTKNIKFAEISPLPTECFERQSLGQPRLNTKLVIFFPQTTKVQKNH